MSLWGQARCLDKYQLIRNAAGKLTRPAANQLKKRAWCNKTIKAVVSGLPAPCSDFNGEWICTWITPGQYCYWGSDFTGGSGPVAGYYMRVFTAASGAAVPDGWILSIRWSAGVGGTLFRSYITYAGVLVSSNYPDAWCPLGVWTITGVANHLGYACYTVEGSVTTEGAA